VIELYAITDYPGPPLPDVAPLKAVATKRLAAVCAPADSSEVSPDSLWRHEEVVEALMKDRDLLPVRFGTRLSDELAAARAVGQRYDTLAVALAGVRGAVELSVRVVDGGENASTPGDAGSGAEYMRARARSAVDRERATRLVHEPLSILARASVQSSPRGSELLRAAYLVDRLAVDGFVALVARLERANSTLRLLCTGPWPPYSFAER
jgi:gas vesicle protein GvpL/GvpF